MEELADIFANSAVGQMRGSPQDGYALFWLNLNQMGESSINPHIRKVQASPAYVKKLVAAVIASRQQDNVSDGLHDGDLFAFCDGGKHGAEVSFVSSFCDSEGTTFQKQKKRF